MPVRFVVDIMLGRLARWLRAMGYDTLLPGPMPGHAGDRRLLRVAHLENRVLVTRDRALARLGAPRTCLVTADALDDQLVELIARLGLRPDPERWLTRCLVCNAELEPRRPDEVAGAVPAAVLAMHASFSGCPGCGRLYWAGSHTDRMAAHVARVLDRARGTAGPPVDPLSG